MRPPHLVIYLLAVALLVPGNAAARPEPREIGPFASAPSSDGSRYVMWTDGGLVRVKDTATGDSFSVATPTDCDPSDIGGRQLLFTCTSYPTDPDGVYCKRYVPLLYSIRGRVFHWPAGTNEFAAMQGQLDTHGACLQASLVAVGRYWIKYIYGGRHDDDGYLNWHSGDNQFSPAESETVALDLDMAHLTNELCEPLRRAEDPNYDREFEFLDRYHPQPVVGRFSAYRRGGQAHFARRLYLQRCGSPKRHLLSTDQRAFGLTRRVVWWKGFGYLHVRLLRSRRHFRYAFPKYEAAGSGELLARVAGTDTRLFVGSADSPGYVIRTPNR